MGNFFSFQNVISIVPVIPLSKICHQYRCEIQRLTSKVINYTEMYPKKYIRKCALFCGFSLFFLISGILLICLRTLLYKSVINKMSLLQPDSYTFHMWKKNPIPLKLKIYLFNWTNAASLYNSSVKPVFQELGPYIFDESKEKVNITWNNNNHTVSFYHLKTWWFNSSESAASLDDLVTSVDPVALTSAVAAKNWNFLIKRGMNVIYRSIASIAYSTHKAGEVLFEGYDDPLINVARSMPSFLAPINLPPNYDKFGWFYTRNNSETYEGQFNMDVGITEQLGELYTWKFENQTAYYRGECGKILGSAGEFFPTDLKKDTVLTFFAPDLCRYVQLEFEKEVLINGIVGYKYVAGDKFLDNGTRVPENKCFCNEECMPSGALDVSACRYGSPAFVSLPHFYKADSYYTDAVDGLNPNKDYHDFFMIFEPKTAMPLHVSVRLQVNLYLQPVSSFSLFKDVPKVYIPVLWFEQSVVIPDDLAFYVKILSNFEGICLTIGIIFILFSIALEICYCYRLCFVNLFKKERILTREEVPLNKKKILT